MEYHIFISYATPDTDLIENFKDHLKNNGIEAWVYSLDKTLAEDFWDEICEKMHSSRVIIFAISEYTASAKGQKKEIEIALNKVRHIDEDKKIFPIALRDTPFSIFPDELSHKNGVRLDAYNVRTVSSNLAKTFFPELVEGYASKEWHYPLPGQWLEVSDMDEGLEDYFDIGDKLYFRSISPLGLFECYAPKIKGLFWIHPDCVKPSISKEEDKLLEANIPREYTVSGMVNILRMGWDKYRESL